MTSLYLRFRKQVIVILHGGTIALSLLTAFLLRFDLALPADVQPVLLQALWIALIVKLPVFALMRLHAGSWRFAGIPELWRLLVTNATASAVFSLVVLVTLAPSGFPRSVCLIDLLVCFLLTGGAQFAARACQEVRSAAKSRRGSKRVVIYGAGAAGRMLLREIQSNPSLDYDVVGFVDDDRRLRGSSVMNVPIVGRGRDLAVIVDRYRARGTRLEEIIVAMPSASAVQTREALANCRSAGVTCKTIPRFHELLTGHGLGSQIREVSMLDLLGREPVRLEEDRIRQSIAGRTVLITGAAGSIGSELCRQTARFSPSRLVLLDQAESPLHNLDLELRGQFPHVELSAVLGDVRDARTVDSVIRRYRVESIFHAAAYKHVPMMEAHILEAVRANIFGTWNMVRAAYRHHVSSFLMISTDKAVNPSSVMGLTKRVAELIVHAQSSNGTGSGTRFASVRFGNVLGSNGSVVPLFQSQIAAGGPVTVTHPDMRRYFMSVPEAVQLVLQASTMCQDSQIFVLDMGEPVRIMDMATNLIRLAGLIPGEDIEIRITGLRPGEKLFEELRIDGEGISPTYHEKIKILNGKRLPRRDLEHWLAALTASVESADIEGVLEHLRELVPEYQPPSLTGAEQPEPAWTLPRSAHVTSLDPALAAPAHGGTSLVQVWPT